MGRDRNGAGTDPAGAAVDVFEAFGVDASTVADRADAVGRDPGFGTIVERAIGGDGEPRVPAAFVRKTIANSPRGIDVPGKYWDSALQIGIGETFADVGARVAVTDADGVPLDESATAPEPFRIEITDAEGETHGVTFSYPETPLGRDNYAAAVHTLQLSLLEGTGFRIVSLSAPDRRWRFALIRTDKLERLQDRYGDRIVLGDHPVLSDHQPDAYVPTDGDDEVFVPSWVERAADDSSPDLSVPDDPEPPEAETDVDAILDGLDPDAIAAGEIDEGMAVATDGGMVVEDFGAFVADLGSVGPLTPRTPESPDPTTDDRGSGPQKSIAVEPDASTDPGSDEPTGDGLDAVFEWIEREVATEAADAGGAGDEYEDAEDVLAAEVFGTQGATDAGSDLDPDSGPDSASAPGSDAAGGTDSEGFDWVDAETLESTD